MAWLRRIALGATLAAGAAACGYPTFKYGTSGAGGQGSGGSGGGTTSSTTSSTSSTTTSSSSSSGFPAMCRLLGHADDCPSGHRCTIADEQTGHTHCVPLASQVMAPYEACLDDSACPAGTWCDWRTATCTPFCDSPADCAGTGGECVSAKTSGLKSIPGVTVCTANCDPVSPTSCGPGAACNYDSNAGSFDCYHSSDKSEGSTCEFGECAPTLVCGSTSCLVWCAPAGADNDAQCGSFGYCEAFSNLVPQRDGVTYGYCF